jgi:parallel beta-helix repeat protein
MKKNNPCEIDGNIHYVGGDGPGNYSSIQDAIDNATNNDIVFVYDDSSPYFENIIVDKSIELEGENKNTTIIDGNNYGDVVLISANSVNITGFTIKNSGDVNRDSGIKIQSRNNRVYGNILLDNDDGIGMISASYNLIFKNNLSNNDHGIRLFVCSRNTIFENNVFSNKFRGIRIETSDNNIVFDNKVYENGNGILFEDSDNNNFTGNKVFNNGVGLDLFSSISSTILDNIFINDGLQVQNSYKNKITNNIVNEKPLIYLEEESDIIIDFDTGQIVIVNCNNITIKYQTIYNVTSGILLWQTNNSLISENVLYSNNYDGILLHSSSNNIIKGNKLTDSENGICLEYSGNDNKIIDNQISNNGYGVHLIHSTGNTNISNNTIFDNPYGVQLYNSHDIIVTNNNIIDNYFGISLWQLSSNNIILSNDIYNCVDGIWLNNANDNRVLRNKIFGSEFDGVWLLESTHNKIAENTIINCFCSVELTYSNYNLIIENTFFEGGIFVSFSYQNTIMDNTINNKSLVYLEDKSDIIIDEAGQVILINCERITIQNNEFYDLMIGLYLESVNYCQILNNTLSDNYFGCWLINSDNNTFSGNVVSNYEQWGLYLYISDDNILSDNTIFLEGKIEYITSFINKNKNLIWRKDYFNEILQFSDDYYIFRNLIIINSLPALFNENNDDSQAILIQSSNRNILSKNDISNNIDGIILESLSKKNIIEKNDIISNKKYGIFMMDSCDKNFIFSNTLEKNGEFGIYLHESSYNKIKKNTFIENNNSAFFKNSFLNRWVKNYWNSFRILPKPIFGRIKIGSSVFKWINIDWRPAKTTLF